MKNIFDEKLEQFKKSSTQVAAEAVVSEKDSILSFVSPVDIVELPTRGIFYPEDHPLYNKEFIEIKQMTAKEEDILTNKSLIKSGLVIDKLIESLLVDKNIKVETLFVGDKNAIMIEARKSAYGPTYEVVASCRECSAKNILEIDLNEAMLRDHTRILDDLIINYLDIEVSSYMQGKIFVRLPKTKWTVQCKLMDGQDEKLIFSILESKRKNGSNAELTISEQLKIISCGLNGHQNKELVESAIDIMPAGDAKTLRSVYQKLVPDIKIQKKFVCRSCIEEQEMEVPFTQEFFWPK